MEIRPANICCVCQGPIARGHKILPVFVVVEAPDLGSPLVYPHSEAAHSVCSDPESPWRHRDIHRKLLKGGVENMAHKLAPSHQCKNCGKQWRAGDRIVEVYVVEGVGIDPQINAPGVRCAGDVEYAHKDCGDPDLSQGREGGRIILNPG